jgi:hypothetical protein
MIRDNLNDAPNKGKRYNLKRRVALRLVLGFGPVFVVANRVEEGRVRVCTVV